MAADPSLHRSEQPPWTRSWFGASLRDLTSMDPTAVLGQLAEKAAASGFSSQYTEATRAWASIIGVWQELARRAAPLGPEAASWTLFLEYEIPRRQRRIDALVLAGDVVIVIEFKVGAREFLRSMLWQVEDYALDLRDFHEIAGRNPIVPVIVATAFTGDRTRVPSAAGDVVRCGPHELADVIRDAYLAHTRGGRIDPLRWDAAAYAPSPTIIEATQKLFGGHSVADLSHHYADNLGTTVDSIVNEVHRARAASGRTICFVTGVPGAGKTLTGLESVHRIRAASHREGVASFLSGNGPLVKILREAIARDAVRQHRGTPNSITKLEATRQSRELIQNVHEFITEYGIDHPESLPPDHVVIYDEAQRAWHSDQVSRFYKRQLPSEPSLLLEIMERVPGWSSIIAVVGGGQEINRGEAGLEEWGRALSARRATWRVVASPDVLSGGESTAGHRLTCDPRAGHIQLSPTPTMHLSVSVRSPRAKHMAAWVDAVLSGRPDEARKALGAMSGFRLGMTRDLAAARAWLRDAARADRRAGLLASSGAARHRAYGLEMDASFHRAFPFPDWFLAGPADIRSSHRLEVALTEFECQGLELDYVGLCWGDDLTIRDDRSWEHRDLRGSSWKSIRDETRKRYLINKYRVLLTRARLGLVVWVPPGDAGDPTRDPTRLDRTAAFLETCGLPTVA